MPKVPIDYSRTQIYKWVCNDSSILCEYVGHTTNWDKRKASHKERCNDETGEKYHLKLYETMRANGGFNNWKMILIEDYPCTGKREAEKREQYHIDLLVEKINTIRAFQTEDQKKEIWRKSHENNKEKRNQQSLQYYIQYKKENQKHKEQKKEYDKKYRENNKEKLNEKYTCECGTIYLKRQKLRHERSQKHILNMAVLTDQDAKVENK
jgi:hypothetical protein